MPHRIVGAIVLSALLPLNASASGGLCPQGWPTDSVTIRLASELTSTVPSASIGITAEFVNESDAIIADALLAVNVVDAAGAIVDRFIAPHRVTMFAGSPAKTDFIWKLPASMRTGEYRVTASILPSTSPRSDAFSFQAGPVALRAIAVSDGASEGAEFVASETYVNGSAYDAYTVSHVATGEPIRVTAVIENQGNAPYMGTLTWRAYAGDALIEAQPLEERREAIELHPGEATTVRFEVSEDEAAAYYIEGALSDGMSARYTDVWIRRGENGAFGWASCQAPFGAIGGMSVWAIALLSITALLVLGIASFIVLRVRTH